MKIESMTLTFLWRRAGLVSLSFETNTMLDVSIHVGVRPICWSWGRPARDSFEYVNGLNSFGLGPLFAMCWAKSIGESRPYSREEEYSTG